MKEEQIEKVIKHTHPLFSETLDPKSFDTLHSMRIYLNIFLEGEVKLTCRIVMAPRQSCKQGLWEGTQ